MRNLRPCLKRIFQKVRFLDAVELRSARGSTALQMTVELVGKTLLLGLAERSPAAEVTA